MRYIGPFEILEMVGTVAYRLVLLPRLSVVKEVFHDSMLRRYTPHSTQGLDWGDLIVDAGRDLCMFEIAGIRFCDSKL